MNVVLGVGLGRSAGSGAAAEPAENLLTWTEAFDNAAWAKTSATVAADAATSPTETQTAEEVAFATGGALRQTTATAATTGVAVTGLADADPSWSRQSLSGSFDGTAYTMSVHLRSTPSATVRLRIDRSSGFLRCSVEDVGDEATVDIWGAQLETGASATAYVARTT